MDIIIRDAKVTDAKAIQTIYTPYVETTAITFEYNVPSEEEFCRRIETVQQKYPWIVAMVNGNVVGYAFLPASVSAHLWRALHYIIIEGDDGLEVVLSC